MGMELVLRKWMEKEMDRSISYSTYMNLTLYDEDCGYYMKEREKIGRNGDFFTSSNISSVFAKTFARFFIRLVENGEIPPNICEIGGGTGRFAYAVLQEWQQSSPETFAKLQYSIVEVSPFHRRLQKRQLDFFQNVSQYKCYEELGESFTGLVFSNELFDAFPVKVVEKRDNYLYEVRITYTDEGKLGEVVRPLEERIKSYLQRHRIELSEGQRFEVPLAMGIYVQEIASWLKEGLFITVDYGYTKEEWMHPAHREGSLRGYYNHRLIRNPLKYPGEMDITAHIHWDELKEIGEENALYTVWHTKQREFLLAAGILEQLASHQDSDPFSAKQKQNRAIRSMILHGGMSDAFDVVVQKKGMPHFESKQYLHI
ncbi:SAM-dependent methyltransferase [Bacillus cereus]|uniref:class I SAM-dependent methyltransferase n=1 Tax=Bacillus cereus TaxID=1396 RepID=UPI000BF3D76A|nr:SAM-dependent methyltransferase [Bacillus cereus]PFA19356.1 SAM-dependent methyltransferase [Bacillus cereus]PFO85997.1 SAM-dependent methyltransferase [Bacillus cereus]PFR26146.1 SAM-dependent methyltransferase [Bacillus cereus]PGZ16508.1 SAM-dependent methyltransferase [Bacillus cereus]